MAGRFFPRIICMSKRIDGNARKGSSRHPRAHPFVCDGPSRRVCCTYMRTGEAPRVHRVLRNSTPTRNSRSSWQFNFQMRRPDQTCHGVHSTDAGFSRAHNSRLQCEFPRCRCTISVQPLQRHHRRSELRIIPAGNASSTENVSLAASLALTKESNLQILSKRISRVEQCLVRRSSRAGSLIVLRN